ncbi:hypothetical protein JD844_012439 [Phrynosoma platyrhinos]|uniref:Uncharacterized protein n=1 Tax=Phrynosoma platyrhinos TaxID=52577 RepID=A0ABQ7TKG4_PHRPL|nr:hypothetical protein JD844_012439 [Phrynosoma platyrhinos]
MDPAEVGAVQPNEAHKRQESRLEPEEGSRGRWKGGRVLLGPWSSGAAPGPSCSLAAPGRKCQPLAPEWEPAGGGGRAGCHPGRREHREPGTVQLPTKARSESSVQIHRGDPACQEGFLSCPSTQFHSARAAAADLKNRSCLNVYYQGVESCPFLVLLLGLALLLCLYTPVDVTVVLSAQLLLSDYLSSLWNEI